ncbi:hypothetical protein ACT17_22795 [Mycolicibacterium conceptionense]|uniref:Uncharacterized protein n=2 Tax=Mycolicibacterium conceptionense TaxID=451644 RepID=A0A0J8U2Z6_9MYCO|nr:hypothetical protein ACT17_22795 [Mycolicibacterium conceptionense]
MPRKGKGILLDARELADQHGWVDEALAAVHAARDAGWTLQEIGDVLGYSREFIRLLYMKDADSAAVITDFPRKPDRPKQVPRIPQHVLARSLISPEEISELSALQKIAARRRSNGDPEAVAAAEELWSRVHHLSTLGVSIYWLSKEMGLSNQALRFGLARYGYRTPSPSQQHRTGQAASGAAPRTPNFTSKESR